MKTADELAASIRRNADRTCDPRQSARLHRLADEATTIRCHGPTVRHVRGSNLR